ncbi:MAG: hypothetical protein JXA14_04905, partial [Anaerolineae bacterium]|nr:hypothetical protein [Anaerolineae bacterium]
RSGREGGRRPALAVVAALAPVASTLMGALRWREAVAKVLETETWFGLSQSLVADTLGLRHSSGTKNLVR